MAFLMGVEARHIAWQHAAAMSTERFSLLQVKKAGSQTFLPERIAILSTAHPCTLRAHNSAAGRGESSLPAIFNALQTAERG